MAVPFELQGHRGARGLKPENTLPSFEAALDCGVRSIETDLHLTRDGTPVLYHDPQLADGTRVASLDLAALRTYRFHHNPNPADFPGQDASVTPLARWYAERQGTDPYAMPTLADLFRFAIDYAGEPGRQLGKSDDQRARAARLIFDLELKRLPHDPQAIGDAYTGDGPALLEERVVDAVRAAGVAERTTVRSFDHRCVRYLRQLEPAVTGAIVVAETAFVEPGELATRSDAKVYCPSWHFVDAGQVRSAHAAGVRVLPWTANAAEEWEYLLSCGVDGITTDYPDQLAAFLRQAGVVF
jgi:glycerophosphoryl diester phosphodiesterase